MSQRMPRPAPAADALYRAQRLLTGNLGNSNYPYWLGTGDYHPHLDPQGNVVLDVPWTTNNGGTGCDCHGLICWAFKLPRHRPGYNHGPWSTCSDDQNCDSAIQDAEHEQDLWTPVLDRPTAGDILVFPSIFAPDGKHRLRIGHVCIIESTARLMEWDPKWPSFELLDIIEVRGGNGRKPAAVRSNGAIWRNRDRFGGEVTPAYRSRVLRSVP